MSDSVLIIAAEASSALYAQRLLQEWKERGREVNAFGVGDKAMIDLGFEAFGRAEDMAVMGLKEVLSHYSEIKKVFYDIVAECEKRRPKFILLLDYPGFNLRLAKELHRLNIPIIYYISPQIWAWKQGRIKQMQAYISKTLVILPFEKDFYKKHGVDVEFVGHPLLDEIDRFKKSSWDRDLMRSRQGIEPEDFLLGLMPGSRKKEIEFHLETQIQAAHILVKKYPFIKVSLLVAKSLNVDLVKSQLPAYEFPLQITQDEPEKMIDLCDFVIAKSGTGTLLVSLLGKPNIIMYKMSAITAWVAKRVVKGVKFFGLTNLIFGEEVIKELFQAEASPEHIAQEVEIYLSQPERMSALKQKLNQLQERLGSTGATKRVADALEAYF